MELVTYITFTHEVINLKFLLWTSLNCFMRCLEFIRLNIEDKICLRIVSKNVYECRYTTIQTLAIKLDECTSNDFDFA